MIGRRAPQPLGLEVEPTLAAARAAVERGPTLGDVPVLALAAARSGGDLAHRLQPWLRIWREAPPALDGDSPEAATLIEVALELGELVVALNLAQRTSVSESDLKRHREYAMRQARANHWLVGNEIDGAQLERYVVTLAQTEREDSIRIARGRVAGLELQFADAIRLAWAAAKNGRRP